MFGVLRMWADAAARPCVSGRCQAATPHALAPPEESRAQITLNAYGASADKPDAALVFRREMRIIGAQHTRP